MPIPAEPGSDDLTTDDPGLIWSRLRMMRSRPPGLAGDDHDRRRRFQAALEQSQQFYDAAMAAPSDTKPVLLFYCSGQALKAWAASSLPTLWRPNSHGLKVTVPNPPTLLGDVTVELQAHRKPDKQTSDYNTLRRLLAEPEVTATELASIAEIWGYLGYLQAPLQGATPSYPSLTIWPYRFTDRNLPPAHPRETAYQVSASRHPHVKAAGEVRAEIARQLPESFAHIGTGTPWSEEDSTAFWAQGLAPAVLDIDLPDCAPWLMDQLQHGQPVEVAARIHNTLPFRDLDLVWIVLAALADVARYEPEFWRACIDVDESPDAESLSAFLTYAQTYVVGMVLRSLEMLE